MQCRSAQVLAQGVTEIEGFSLKINAGKLDEAKQIKTDHVKATKARTAVGHRNLKRRRHDDEEKPDDDGWDTIAVQASASRSRTTGRQRNPDVTLNSSLFDIANELKRFDKLGWFVKPVDTKKFPLYKSWITNPMDISTIALKVCIAVLDKGIQVSGGCASLPLHKQQTNKKKATSMAVVFWIAWRVPCDL